MQTKNTRLQALIIRLILIFFCIFVSGAHRAQAGAEELLQGAVKYFKLQNPHAPLPDIEFLDGGGQPVRLSQFRGKLVLLTLWATWCPYCLREMPSLNDLQAALGGPNFMVLPVSVDKGGPEIAKQFLEERSFNLPTFSDPHSAIKTATGTRGIPYAILIDKEGREIGRIHGETNWMAGETINLIKYFMN